MIRLCQLDRDGETTVGMDDGSGRIVDATRMYNEVVSDGYSMPGTILSIIEDGDGGLAALKRLATAVESGHRHEPYLVSTEDFHVGAPIGRPPKFFCLAINQGEGWRRATKPEAPRPLYFIKVHTAITGPYDPIRIPDIGKVGSEIELAIIIGKGGRNIRKENAMEHVFGYTVHNDITAHELRKKQEWIQSNRKDGSSERLTYTGRYKNFDTFSPMGPWLTLAGPDLDPHNLEMRAYLNGELIQSGNTKDYIFSFSEVIAYLSEAHSLEAGDIISSGTCPYVPPRTMSTTDLLAGDLSAEISGIGRLNNPIERVRSEAPEVEFAVSNG